MSILLIKSLHMTSIHSVYKTHRLWLGVQCVVYKYQLIQQQSQSIKISTLCTQNAKKKNEFNMKEIFK